MTDEEKAQIAGRRCFCGWWPCETHSDQDRIDHAISAQAKDEPERPHAIPTTHLVLGHRP